MTKSQTTKQTLWIGDLSWCKDLSCSVDIHGKVCGGVIFKTKQDAKFAGWEKPTRVVVSIKKFRAKS